MAVEYSPLVVTTPALVTVTVPPSLHSDLSPGARPEPPMLMNPPLEQPGGLLGPPPPKATRPPAAPPMPPPPPMDKASIPSAVLPDVVTLPLLVTVTAPPLLPPPP